MFDHPDSFWMSQALELAKKGLYSTHPNPRVGCIIVQNDHIVGKGWHEACGKSHAEVLALEEAQGLAAGATCYVTLEPCAHFGRTPPCDQALIQSGISRVVISTQDPNPKVAGQGIHHLRQAGIAVEVGPFESQAQALNRGYFKRFIQGSPWVTCKMAMSLDGRTALASGESQWLTGSEVKQEVMHLRAQSSAILTGIGTVLKDDPLLTVRDIETKRQPLRIILDSTLRIEPSARILKGPSPNTLIATTSPCPHKRKILENQDIQVVVLPSNSQEKVSLQALLQYLALEHQVNEVMLEAGSTLSSAFLTEELIDELVIFMAPKLLGNSAKGLFQLPFIKTLNDSVKLKITEITPVGTDWKIRAIPLYPQSSILNPQS